MWWMVGLAKTLQTCKAESFLKIINGWELLTIDTKVPILDVNGGPSYSSVISHFLAKNTHIYIYIYNLNFFVNIILPNKSCNFIEKETQAQVFSCEFCEISKNVFFYRIPLVAASVRS